MFILEKGVLMQKLDQDSRSQTKICKRQLRCQKLIFQRKDASLRFYFKLLCEITMILA